MSDVVLGVTNEADSQTAINSHNDFLGSESVFLANGGTPGVANKLNGLEGVGNNGGAGVVGQGGKPWQAKQPLVAGPGVIGRGGPVDDREFPGLPGPGVVGLATDVRDPRPQDSSGTGVYGRGVVGVLGQATGDGTGVLGVVAEIELPDAKRRAGAGVYGESWIGPGVVGIAAGPSIVDEQGAPGVVGEGGSGPGGSFSSSLSGQVHLTPSASPSLPALGIQGDLWAHVDTSPLGERFRGAVSLYLCVQDVPDVRWQKVLLDPSRLKGGTPV